MNIQKLRQDKRRAISPVLATVILIAITLIAAIAIAGFVFGLFGTFTSTARVQASVTSCTSPAPNQQDCAVLLSNSGNANTTPTGTCSLTYGGHTYAGSTATPVITAGSSVPVTCHTATAAQPIATVGSQITGAVILANGGNALFTSTAS